ncbi:RBBP9/YdeN family alpha/beta hydrolase [Microbacterium sp.]|uniref:RBBP9/YdeN family alpha/beta hydrolase n=1 Tax=Microbacterium sp. TaxID=51671 RepID=UPI003C718A59
MTDTLVPPVVVLPGLGGSDAGHWQTVWQQADRRFTRIAPSSWDEPELDDWIAAVDRAIGHASPVLVAHSLGCLTAIEWTRRNPGRDVALFLVALPDPAAQSFPLPESAFTGIPLAEPLTVPALMIASGDDAYCAPERSAEIAAALGAAWIAVGDRGHLNAASGLATWREGRGLLTAFAAGSGRAI